jgi:hypothetical protein
MLSLTDKKYLFLDHLSRAATWAARRRCSGVFLVDISYRKCHPRIVIDNKMIRPAAA